MPTLAEAAKEYSDDQYRLINDPASKKDERRELLKTRLKELYIAEYRLKRANKTIKQLEQSEKATRERINEMLSYLEIRELFTKLREEKEKKEKREEEKKKEKEEEDSDSDDEEDEFVSVQGIKYLVVEEEVVDLKSGKIVGKMEDGKVVFSKPGTKLHKKRVDELNK